MTLRGLVLAAALLATPGLAGADEPTGCGAFRWPIDRERASLAEVSKVVVADGGAIRYDEALTLELAPFSGDQPPARARARAEDHALVCRALHPRRPGQAGSVQADNRLRGPGST